MLDTNHSIEWHPPTTIEFLVSGRLFLILSMLPLRLTNVMSFPMAVGPLQPMSERPNTDDFGTARGTRIDPQDR